VIQNIIAKSTVDLKQNVLLANKRCNNATPGTGQLRHSQQELYQTATNPSFDDLINAVVVPVRQVAQGPTCICQHLLIICMNQASQRWQRTAGLFVSGAATTSSQDTTQPGEGREAGSIVSQEVMPAAQFTRLLYIYTVGVVMVMFILLDADAAAHHGELWWGLATAEVGQRPSSIAQHGDLVPVL
jgi:hypothetical protein